MPGIAVLKVEPVHAFIIEDEYLISRSIQDMLGELGFKSFSFARSEDATVAGANGENFDLITADARLLPGDGIKAVQTICAKRDIPVVFISGYAADIQDRFPGAAIVEKPIKPAALEEPVDLVEYLLLEERRVVPVRRSSANVEIASIEGFDVGGHE